MSEQDQVRTTAVPESDQEEQLERNVSEGATPGTVGAVDGAAAAGSLGAVSGQDQSASLFGDDSRSLDGPD